MANNTQYTDEQSARALAALKANGGNTLKTAKMLGIPRSTLRQWAGATKYTAKVTPAAVLQDKTQEIADRLEAVAFKAVDPKGMSEALDKASAKDRMIAAGIAIEKRQLLIGAPTSRDVSLQVTLVASGTLNELGQGVLKALSAGEKRTE